MKYGGQVMTRQLNEMRGRRDVLEIRMSVEVCEEEAVIAIHISTEELQTSLSTDLIDHHLHVIRYDILSYRWMISTRATVIHTKTTTEETKLKRRIKKKANSSPGKKRKKETRMKRAWRTETSMVWPVTQTMSNCLKNERSFDAMLSVSAVMITMGLRACRRGIEATALCRHSTERDQQGKKSKAQAIAWMKVMYWRET